MNYLPTAESIIEMICDGDHPVGQRIITIGEMIELHQMTEKEKTAC